MSMAKGLGLGLVAGGAIGAGVMALVGGGGDAALQPGAEMVPVQKAELEQLRTRSADYDALAKQLADAERAAQDAAAEETGGVGEWKARVEALEAEKQKLQAELAVARQAAVETPPTAAAAPGVFKFGLKGDTPTFDKADWKALGNHMSELAKVLAALPESLSKGEPLDMATRQKIGEHNTPLAAFALQAAAELGGTGANGAYTHPSVIANLMRAALQNAGHPLSSEQEAGISQLGAAWVEAVNRRQATYDATTIQLQKTVDEVDDKQAFLDAARALMTAEQQGVLFPPETVGRAQLDLLSPGLVYAMRMPVQATSRAEIETQLLTQMLSAAGLTGADPAQYAFIATAWIDALPPAMLDPRPARDPDVMFPHVSAIQSAARAQIVATKKLLAMGELTDEQAATVRKNTTVLHPVVLKTD